MCKISTTHNRHFWENYIKFNREIDSIMEIALAYPQYGGNGTWLYYA